MADFSASNSSTSVSDRSAFAMFGLLKCVSGKADTVALGGKCTDNNVCIPAERVVASLDYLLAMAPPQFCRNLGAANLQYGLSLPCPVVGAASVIRDIQSTERHDTVGQNQRQCHRSQLYQEPRLHRRAQPLGLLDCFILPRN